MHLANAVVFVLEEEPGEVLQIGEINFGHVGDTEVLNQEGEENIIGKRRKRRIKT